MSFAVQHSRGSEVAAGGTFRNYNTANVLPGSYRGAYGNGVYVTTKGSGTGNIAYSTDGVTWSNTTQNSDNTIRIIYANGKFVGVGARDSAIYSTDGINWYSSNTFPTTDVQWYGIAYGNGKFVAVGGVSGINGKGLYSTDGITWYASNNLPGLADASPGVVFGNNKFVYIGYTGRPSMYSSDGITWNLSNTVTTDYSWFSLAYGNGKFVAGTLTNSGAASKMAYSSDGMTWTIINKPTTITSWDNLVYGNGLFIQMNTPTSVATSYIYSKDGVNWKSGTVPYGSYYAVFNNDKNRFLFLDYNSSGRKVLMFDIPPI